MSWLAGQWRRFWFEPSSATNLAISRFTFFALLYVIYQHKDSALWAQVPDAMWSSIPLFRILRLPVGSSDVLHALDILWKGSLVFASLGLLTRLSTTTAFALGVYLMGLPQNFGKIHHSSAIAVLALGIMAVSRCGDAWSCDSLWKARRRFRWQSEFATPAPAAEYTWPLRLVWAAMALALFSAGVSKLRASGWDWITTDNLAVNLVSHQYTDSPPTALGPWMADVPLLTHALAAATIAFELAAPAALVSRRARGVVIPGLLAMQMGIYLTMGVFFATFMTVYVFWVPWERAGTGVADFRRAVGAVASRVEQRGPHPSRALDDP